ncbi:tyrosine-type recombinase/integrase [Flectobacillus major]|uniref:tyrosine-type recombinase/integrase n=1 Tax=Flectobacillus major TaxID=103 RepID=UPI000402222A|nr:tyrosine-type recombinase/integrase [Flectobacillus major]
MDKQHIVPFSANQLSTEHALIEKAKTYGQKGIEGAINTQRAYQHDIQHYEAWCTSHQVLALPATVSTLILYVTHLADTYKWATINRKIAVLRKYHTLAGHDLPSQDSYFKAVIEGIKRSIGVRQKQASAFKMQVFKNTIKDIDTSHYRGLRNKALLLLGFAGAFRRSELALLSVKDLHFNDAGIIINIAFSKTNQYNEAEEKAIFYSPDFSLCPVRTLQKWISTAQLLHEDAVFTRIRKNQQLTTNRLTDKSVNDIFQQYFGKEYSAHSLRASFITIAKINGADDAEIMRQTKHKTSLMIQRYTRIDDITIHNAALKLGL